jgi:protein-tyrosine phosphatase
MHEVLAEQLWIGHAQDARDARRLLDMGIAAVVDLAYEETPAQLPRSVVYCRIPLVDGGDNDPRHLRLAVKAVATLIDAGIPTLVSCGAGMSRSPIVAAAALSLHHGEPPKQALQTVAQSHPHDVSLTLWEDVLKALENA